MRTFSSYFRISCLAILALAGCSQNETATEQTASSRPSVLATDTTVFINGDILTMNDSQPTAEALAMKGGKIIAIGQEKTVRDAAGKTALIRDLSGHTLIPGLIDTHGHIGLGSFTAGVADLQPPPAGNVSNMKEMTAALVKWSDAHPDAPWIIGFGYDDSLLAEGRHPTREDLDKISTEKPIALMHVSGHLATCNTPCLAAGGITAETENPPGGVIRRMPGSSEPNGVLEETATGLALGKMPFPTAPQTMQAINAQQANYASYGITTAQDGASNLGMVKLLEAMAASDQLKIDIVAYPALKKPEDFVAAIVPSQDYIGGFRVGGIKVSLDGSPQGKTAWITKPYHIAPPGTPKDYTGYPIFETEDVNTIVKQAFERNIPVLAHANGDAASDQLLGAVKLANKALGKADRRTVMIHAQTARDDQIDDMKIEGVLPSYFVSHTFFWGDWHRDSVFGIERASRISPLKTTLSKGVPFTIHNDAPIVPPDMMRLVWTAVMRETRSGKTLGEAERVTPTEALKAVTINAAYQYFEEDSKGSLETGKLADLVILSENPTTVSPGDIKDIRVLETIKEGETIFVAE